MSAQQFWRRNSFPIPSAASESRCVIAIVQARKAYRAAGARRVDEAPLSNVDPDMIHKQPSAQREEHQVPGLKLAAVQWQALLALFDRGTRQAHS